MPKLPGIVQEKKKVNVAGRSRPVRSPYASWFDRNLGCRYLLIKSWQVDNGGPYARWHVFAEGEFSEYGDMYVSELIREVEGAADLVFDTALWPSREAFISWARGSR